MTQTLIVHRRDKVYSQTVLEPDRDRRFIPAVGWLMMQAWSDEFPWSNHNTDWPRHNVDPAIVWVSHWFTQGETPDRPDDPVYYRAFDADGHLLDAKDTRTVAEMGLGEETHIYLLLPSELKQWPKPQG